MDSSLDIGYYLSVLKRRYLYFIVPFVLVFAVSSAVALLLPPVYRSEAKILILSQQIPTNLVQSTVTSLADERIQVIEQRVMTRDNLLKIVRKFKIFQGNKDRFSPSELVEKMRNQVQITRLALATRGRKRSTIAFTVSFEHKNPGVTVKVANEIVTLILNEDVRARTTRAVDTTKFLGREVDRLEKQLAVIESQVTDFKQKNESALPSSLNVRLSRLEILQNNLKEFDREVLSIKENKTLLELQFSTLANGDNSGTPLGNTSLQQLGALKLELLRKAALFSSSHPAIKALESQISALEKSIKLQGEVLDKKDNSNGDDIEKVDPAMPPVMAVKMTTYNSRLTQLQQQREKLLAAIVALNQSIARTPEVERALTALTRRYENKQKSFDELLKKQQLALLGEKLEDNKQAEHFEVIEQPVLPQQPIKPNRKKIIALGFMLAMAAGGGGIFLIEMLNKSIRTGADLVVSLNRHPLVSIPYVVTRSEIKRGGRQRKLLFILAIILAVATLTAVHIFYMNLDILFIKVIDRLQ
jgi:protein tyrosine kinase modulator